MARQKENVWEADKLEVFTADLPNKDLIFDALQEAAEAPKKKEEKKEKPSAWTAEVPSKDAIFLADKEVVWDKKILDNIPDLPTHRVEIDGVVRMLYHELPKDIKDFRNKLSSLESAYHKTIRDAGSSNLFYIQTRGEPYNWHFDNPLVRLFNVEFFPEGDLDFALKVVRQYYPNFVFYAYRGHSSINKTEYGQPVYEDKEYTRESDKEVRQGMCTGWYFHKNKYHIDHLICALFAWVDSLYIRHADAEGKRSSFLWRNSQDEVADPFAPVPVSIPKIKEKVKKVIKKVIKKKVAKVPKKVTRKTVK